MGRKEKLEPYILPILSRTMYRGDETKSKH
jgi:hypothetical protein